MREVQRSSSIQPAHDFRNLNSNWTAVLQINEISEKEEEAIRQIKEKLRERSLHEKFPLVEFRLLNIFDHNLVKSQAHTVDAPSLFLYEGNNLEKSIKGNSIDAIMEEAESFLHENVGYVVIPTDEYFQEELAKAEYYPMVLYIYSGSHLSEKALTRVNPGEPVGFNISKLGKKYIGAKIYAVDSKNIKAQKTIKAEVETVPSIRIYKKGARRTKIYGMYPLDASKVADEIERLIPK